MAEVLIVMVVEQEIHHQPRHHRAILVEQEQVVRVLAVVVVLEVLVVQVVELIMAAAVVLVQQMILPERLYIMQPVAAADHGIMGPEDPADLALVEPVEAIHLVVSKAQPEQQTGDPAEAAEHMNMETVALVVMVWSLFGILPTLQSRHRQAPQ